MCRPPRFALSFVLVAATVSATAAAYEEQWHFGGGIGAAKFVGTEHGTAPMLGLHVAYDVSDMFDF